MIKRFKKFEELEWGRFWNEETFNFLEEVFVDFLYPVGKEYPSKSDTIKMGTNMMASYVIFIPFSGRTIPEFNTLLIKIEDRIEMIKGELPNIGYDIELISSRIKLSIWNR